MGQYSVHINKVMVMDCSFCYARVDIAMTQSSLVVVCKWGFCVPRRDLNKALRRACSGYSKLINAFAHWILWFRSLAPWCSFWNHPKSHPLTWNLPLESALWGLWWTLAPWNRTFMHWVMFQQRRTNIDKTRGDHGAKDQAYHFNTFNRSISFFYRVSFLQAIPENCTGTSMLSRTP